MVVDSKKRTYGIIKYLQQRGFYVLYALGYDKAPPLKIGYCASWLVGGRLGAYKTANVNPVRFHIELYCAGKAMATRLESEVHKDLKDSHIRGEWFDVDPEKAEATIRTRASQAGAWLKTADQISRGFEIKIKGSLERSMGGGQ